MIVYTHTRLDTNMIFYVGIGKTEKRAYNKKTSRSKYWKNIVGKTEYSVEIVHECETWDEACYTERYLISYYGRKDLGLGELCNLTDGGEGTMGRIFSAEYRAKLSKAATGRILSPETRAKMSGKIRTEEHCAKLGAANKGRKMSDEHKAKLIAINKGKKRSKEICFKIGMANRGKTISDEHKAKISAAQKGRKMSDENRAKVSAFHKGRVVSNETRDKLREAWVKRRANMQK